MALTLSLILALWQNWRKDLELTSISPRVAEDLCAMILGFRLQPPLLNVVKAEPAQDEQAIIHVMLIAQA